MAFGGRVVALPGGRCLAARDHRVPIRPVGAARLLAHGRGQSERTGAGNSCRGRVATVGGPRARDVEGPRAPTGSAGLAAPPIDASPRVVRGN
jgi:hypothetical protein